jgi:acetyl esterase/lipase
VLGVNYRLSPEYRFPAQIDDSTAVYRALLERGISPAQIAFAGDSAGGGLIFSTLINARHLGLPMPAAAIGIGAWVDLAVTGASMIANAGTDPIVKGDQIRRGAAYYLNGVSPYAPLASPIYADLAGLPPMLLQVSKAECFLDDSHRLAGRAQQAGVSVTLSEWDGMVHGWHQFAAFLPEADQAIAEIADFLNNLAGWKDASHG